MASVALVTFAQPDLIVPTSLFVRPVITALKAVPIHLLVQQGRTAIDLDCHRRPPAFAVLPVITVLPAA